MDTLIIAAPLVCPPSETLAFRMLTMISHNSLTMDVLLEVEQEFKDMYYRSYKPKGHLDYVDAIVTPEEHVAAIRIDFDYNSPLTIKTDRIVWGNFHDLTAQIQSLRSLNRKLEAGLY